MKEALPEKPKFWVGRNLTLLDSRPKPPQTKIYQRTPRGDTKSNRQNPNPKNNERRLALLSKKNPKFWVRRKP
jgi:hypothetical protein